MSLRFEDLELDLRSYQLRRNGSVIKLEKIPMELLTLLASKSGQLVSREEIIEKLWGKETFVDSEQGINTAIRKIRNALKDDPDQPRFIETVVGKGYRFVASVTRPVEEPPAVAVRAPSGHRGLRADCAASGRLSGCPIFSAPKRRWRTDDACCIALSEPDRRCRPRLLQ